jgi:hypothetical protein
MWTPTESAAADSAVALQEAIQGDARWAAVRPDCVEFAYSYNRLNFFGLGDIGAVILQYFATNVSAGFRVLAGLADPSPEFSDAMVATAADVDVLGCLATGHDCAKFAAEIDSTIRAGKKTLVVAHSQGNFYTNAIYEGLSSSALDQSLMRIVGVGTPDHNSGVLAQYTNLALDPVAWLSGLQPTSHNGFCFSLGCHFFDSSYLSGDSSRARILNEVFAELPRIDPSASPIVHGAMISGDSLLIENCGAEFPGATRYTGVLNGALIFEASPYGFACATAPIWIQSLTSYYSQYLSTPFISVWTFYDGIGSLVERAHFTIYWNGSTFSLTPHF